MDTLKFIKMAKENLELVEAALEAHAKTVNSYGFKQWTEKQKSLLIRKRELEIVLIAEIDLLLSVSEKEAA